MKLTHTHIIDVRFHEVDALDIVWHGHYVKYFELAREAFGEKFGLGYRHMRKNHIAVPIVKLTCDYKKPLTYGDQARVVVRFNSSLAAKLVFDYEVYNHATNMLVATGHTEQVFIEADSGDLILNYPDFVRSWLDQWTKP